MEGSPPSFSSQPQKQIITVQESKAHQRDLNHHPTILQAHTTGLKGPSQNIRRLCSVKHCICVYAVTLCLNVCACLSDLSPNKQVITFKGKEARCSLGFWAAGTDAGSSHVNSQIGPLRGQWHKWSAQSLYIGYICGYHKS